MTVEEFLAYFKEHPELIPEAIKLMHEIEKNRSTLAPAGPVVPR